METILGKEDCMSSQHEDELETRLRQRLEGLRTPAPRDPQKAMLGRERYLSSVKALQAEKARFLPVSATPLERLNEWIKRNLNPPMRKERKLMFSLLTTIMVVVTLMAGGAGAVYAAQDSLPDDFLYPVKTLAEDVRLGLTSNPQSEVELALAYANRRVAEMVALQVAGEAIPEDVAARLLAELDLALDAAATMEDPDMIQALDTIGVHIRKLDRDMVQGRTKAPIDADPLIEQVRAMLRWQVGLVDDALVDPGGFRLRLNQPVASTSEPVTTETPLETEVPLDDTDPNGFGPGPQNQGVITQTLPMDGYGPGPGPGPGPQNQGVITQTLPVDPFSPGPFGDPAQDNTPPGGSGPGPVDSPEPPANDGNGGGGSGSGKP